MFLGLPVQSLAPDAALDGLAVLATSVADCLVRQRAESDAGHDQALPYAGVWIST
jgi:hypothetical protein